MAAAGTPTPRTYSEKIIDDYVTEWTDKVAGKVTQQGKKTISKDGKTMTLTVDGRPSQTRVMIASDPAAALGMTQVRTEMARIARRTRGATLPG